jgi:hypothetical protein
MHRQVRRPAFALLVVLAAALTAAGCGGDGSLSKSEYVEKNNAIQTEAMESIGTLGTASSDPEKAAAQLEEAQAGIDKAVKDLDALKPPSDWKDEHADLVASLKEMGTVIGEMQTAAKEKDVEALTQAITDINELQTKSSDAINAMNSDR